MDIHKIILGKMRPYRTNWPPDRSPGYDTSNGRGQWISLRTDRLALGDVFNDACFTLGVEVGTQRGHHAAALCSKNRNLRLICVDPYSTFGRKGQSRMESNYMAALRNLEPFNAEIMRMTSMEAVGKFKDRSLDFVYIDGDHRFDYIAPDIIFWSKKVKQGGIVACHDYCNWYEVGVMQAVDAYVFCHDIRIKYITFEPTPTAFWVNP